MKELESVYSGTEASVLLLKGKLDRMGIAAQVRRDSNAGTWGVVSDKVDLCIEPSQKKEAEPIINEFIHNRHTDKF